MFILHPKPWSPQIPFLRLRRSYSRHLRSLPGRCSNLWLTDTPAGLLLPAHPGAALSPSTRGSSSRRRWQGPHRSMAQNAGSETQTVERACEPWNRDPGMSAAFGGQLHAARCCRGYLCVLVTAACSSVAATVCPWPPWQLRDPSSPPPPGPAPAPSRPPTATKGKPHPRSPPGQGSVGARTAPRGLALERCTPTPGGIRWPVCTLRLSLGELNISPLVPSFWGPYGPVAHTTVPALGGPEPLCKSPGRGSGHSGT